MCHNYDRIEIYYLLHHTTGLPDIFPGKPQVAGLPFDFSSTYCITHAGLGKKVKVNADLYSASS